MKIQSINNNQYNIKPNFGAMKVAKSVKNEYLKEIVENPEFSKLAKQLEEKGKDLIIKQDTWGLEYHSCIELFSKSKHILSIPRLIKQITKFDHESNTLKFALRDFSVEKLVQEINAEEEAEIAAKAERKVLTEKLNSLNESIEIPKPIEKKNFIQRLLGL